MMNYFKILLSNNSILRVFQKEKFKEYKLSGDCLEFGANKKISRNFLNSKSLQYRTFLSNIDNSSKKFIKIDIEKKINHKKKYDNVIFFNILEHLSETNKSIKNVNLLLKKNGQIIGSTPFLYRVHGAPNDYYRFTKSSLEKILKDNRFKNIDIKEIGSGPFLASFSILRGYLKFLPGIYHVLLAAILVLDKIISGISNTKPNKIYPIGYIFSAKKK